MHAMPCHDVHNMSRVQQNSGDWRAGPLPDRDRQVTATPKLNIIAVDAP